MASASSEQQQQHQPWNAANADAMTVDSWGGGTQMSAFPPLVPVNSQPGLYKCPTHPEHRTTDPSSFCPLCEAAWEDQRRELRAKRHAVEEQLQNLTDSNAILQDLQVSMQDWKPQPDQQASPESVAAPRTDFFGRTHPHAGVNSGTGGSGNEKHRRNNNNNNHLNNNNFSSSNNNNRPYQAFPANGLPGKEQPPPPPPPPPAGMPPPSFFSPFYDTNGTTTSNNDNNNQQMQAFALQLQSVQRMQDWMLYQKEQECQQLRQALEEKRSEVQQLQVDKALLQEKLYQQEERMKHELKLIKLAALQQQQQSRKKSGKSSNSPAAAGVGGTTTNVAAYHTNHSSSSSNHHHAAPIGVLPDHMLSASNNHNNNKTAETTHHALATNTASAFNTPAVITPESPEINRSLSHDESVKSKDSVKRRTKSPGSWIRSTSNKSSNEVVVVNNNKVVANESMEKSPDHRLSSPVDTDDFVDQADHAPDDLQQQPSMATASFTNNEVTRRVKDGYGTDDSDDDDDDDDNVAAHDDDDTSFRQLVAAAQDLPDGTASLFSLDESAPKQVVAPKASPSKAPASPRGKAPSSPARGVSFPDTTDDNASLGNTVASSTFGEDRQKVVDQVILDPYGDKGTYTGIILRSTGMPHGPGRMIYQEDRRTYDGEWRHGRWHGYGRATFANGDTYDGEYRFDQRHGRGRYQWSDGRVYDGLFREDRRHGRGTFTWPDGAVYEGEFRAGQREGQGTYQFSDGGRYEGSWKDGRYNGYGVCKWEDGRCYKGEWLNGMAHGKGIETFADGTVRHDGQWIEDEPV